jgi:hypothetical protein
MAARVFSPDIIADSTDVPAPTVERCHESPDPRAKSIESPFRVSATDFFTALFNGEEVELIVVSLLMSL